MSDQLTKFSAPNAVSYSGTISEDHDSNSGFQSVDDALDSLFSGVDEDSLSESTSLAEFSEEIECATQPEVKELFERIFLQYLQPIRDFIDNLSHGQLPASVVQSFAGTLQPLIDATSQLNLVQMNTLLGEFKDLLEGVETIPQPVPYKFIRPFASRYDQLIELLSPEIREEYFSDIRYQPKSNPLLEEFRKIRQIGPKRLQRLYAAGLTTIESVEIARSEDIAVTTGMTMMLANELKDVARMYRARREREQIHGVGTNVRELTELIKGLRYDRTLRVVRTVLPQLNELRAILMEECEFLGKKLAASSSRSIPLDRL